MPETTAQEAKQTWTCKGRNGSGCGWKYHSPIHIEEVRHTCPDGVRRNLTKTREVKR